MHIGLHKTGTTALQEFFSLNRGTLGEKGISYLRKNHLLSDCWTEGEDSDRLVAKRWTTVRDRLASGPGTVLASNESLSSELYGHPERVEQLMDFLCRPETVIILYLRRQDVHLESLYRQLIRGSDATAPFSVSVIDELLHPDYYDYEKKVRFFADQFGKENVRVRVYDRARFAGGSLFSDFTDALGLAWDDAFVRPPKGVNESMDARLMDFMLFANARLPEENGQLRQFKDVIDTVEKGLFEAPESRLLTADERLAFLESCEEGNDWVRREFVGGQGPLFPPPAGRLLEDPKRITNEDFHGLLLLLNAAWNSGFGAVPFPLYNYRKIEHLRRKRQGATGVKRALVSVQLGFHKLLHLAKLYLVPTRWPGRRLDGTILRYVNKDALFVRKGGK
ncbi:hypothetical protein [Pseudodesulfovibrio indicus]|uniref:hypothetical protein n=1 Tax=Pseudodesulfovibrio indicus TaxID=1716143 RepID=UPI00292FD56A|nr:hypothetical protein [Pseudodesulfovibrio indicus]